MNTSYVHIKAPAILHLKDVDFPWVLGVRSQPRQGRLLADPCQIPSAPTFEGTIRRKYGKRSNITLYYRGRRPSERT